MDECRVSGIYGYPLSQYKVFTLGEGAGAIHVTVSYALRAWRIGISSVGPAYDEGRYETGQFAGRGWRLRLDEAAKAYLLAVAGSTEAEQRDG